MHSIEQLDPRFFVAQAFVKRENSGMGSPDVPGKYYSKPPRVVSNFGPDVTLATWRFNLPFQKLMGVVFSPPWSPQSRVHEHLGSGLLTYSRLKPSTPASVCYQQFGGHLPGNGMWQRRMPPAIFGSGLHPTQWGLVHDHFYHTDYKVDEADVSHMDASHTRYSHLIFRDAYDVLYRGDPDYPTYRRVS